jgi:hypothetical protein
LPGVFSNFDLLWEFVVGALADSFLEERFQSSFPGFFNKDCLGFVRIA